MSREINDLGLEMLVGFEAFVPYAYDDADGTWPRKRNEPGDPVHGTLTIGFGHTATVAQGMEITEEEAYRLLEEDLSWAERAVEAHVKVPLNDNEFAALVSFVYNIGEPQFRSSTLLRLLNAGDRGSVPRQLARWDKTTVNGKKVQSKGLARRRAAEAALWATPMEGVMPESRTHVVSIPDRTAADTLTVKGAALSGAAAVGSILVDAASSIQTVGGVSEYFQMLAAGLLVIGIGLTVYGRLRVMTNEGV